MNGITFTLLSGGLGRPLSGEDHVTGLVTFMANADLPAGFTTTDRIKPIYSKQDAIDLGITVDSAVDEIKILHYQIAELFRLNKKAVVYVGIDDSAVIDYSFVETVQLFAEKKIRQFGVIDCLTAYASGTLTSLQSSATNMFDVFAPCVIVYGCDTSGIALASLANLRALACPNVGVVAGQDGSADGADLATAVGVSVPNVGAIVGLLSASKVHENIGWVAKFNAVTGLELDVPAFGDGALVKNQTESLLTQIETKGWIFFRKHSGIAGTYANDSSTATPETGDYAYLENNRTIQKAIRGVRTFMTPDISAPLYLKPDGTLQETTVSHFANNAKRALDAMLTDGEISAFEVNIDPSQNVLSTSTLNIGITIVPVGVARQIDINIGFATSL
jgi:hypothetical protein